MYSTIPSANINAAIEGKDQIRGWFNLLHLLSVMVNKQKSFKNCYMHGFVVDEGEDKMSKSTGNFEDPTAVYAKHGVDPLRLYLIGAATPGMDLRFSLQHLLVRYILHVSIFLPNPTERIKEFARHLELAQVFARDDATERNTIGHVFVVQSIARRAIRSVQTELSRQCSNRKNGTV